MQSGKLSHFDGLAYKAAASLYSVEKHQTEAWIRNNIGNPEYGWDTESVYEGFLRPMKKVVEDHYSLFYGAICASLIEACELTVAGFQPVIETAERIYYTVLVLENLILGNHDRRKISLFDSYNGAIEGQITAHLMSACVNLFTQKNPCDLPNDALLRVHHEANRETVRMLYVTGMQLYWMKESDESLKNAMTYSCYGPKGAGLRLAMKICWLSVQFDSDAEYNNFVKVADELAIMASILDDFRQFSATYKGVNWQDFKVGKVTPLTVYAAELWKLSIPGLISLQSGLTIKELLEHPMGQCIDLLYEKKENIDIALQQLSTASSLNTLSLYADQIIDECSRVLKELPND